MFSEMEREMQEITRQMEASHTSQSLQVNEAFLVKDDKSGIGGIGGLLVGGGMIGGGIGMATAASAAIAASVTAVPVAGLTAVTSGLSYLGLGGLAPSIAALWPTTAVATAPSALLLAMGPIGWTLAGVGILAVPLSWGIAKKKQKSGMQEQVETQISDVFQKLRNDRMPGLRKGCDNILEEFRITLDRRIIAIEDALDRAAASPCDPDAMAQEKRRLASIGNLLDSKASHYLTAK